MKALNNIRQKALLLLLLVAAGVVKAQSHEFAPVGAEWYYSRLYREGWNFTGVAYDRFRSLRTVEINGWECKEIELYQHLDEYGIENPHSELFYITQEQDKIYEVENGQRLLLYDFGKGIGESWYSPKYGLNVYVIDTLTIELNDGSHRKVVRTFLQGEFDDYWYYDNIIEGIGLDKSVFPFLEFDGPPQSIHDYIRCYSEDGVPLIVSETVECDYEILAIDEHDEPSIVPMNTLVDDVLRIDFSKMQHSVKRVIITDLTGKDVGTYETMENEIYINFFDQPAGIYLIQTIIGSQVINSKIVKR